MEEPDSGFAWHELEIVEFDHPAPASTYLGGLDDLAAALDGVGDLRSDGPTGRRSLEMVMGIYQSHLEGNRPVHFPVSLRERGVEALRRAGVFERRADEG
jgi:hypothetical protein